MTIDKLIANISRDFLKTHRVTRYQMKIVSDLSDQDVISVCHSFCEENCLTREFFTLRGQVLSKYRSCAYLKEYIDGDLCSDLQMIASNSIEKSAFLDQPIDREKVQACCDKCRYQFK